MADKKVTKPATPAPAAAGTPAPAGNDALAAARAAREQAAGKDTFQFVKDLEKGAPQAKKIVEILKAAGKPMTRIELVAAMKGVVVTRQPESRILSYYQKDLQTAGAISITKASVTTPAAPATPATPPAA